MNSTGIALIVYFVIFVALSMGWRSYVVWRRTGLNPLTLGRSQSAHDFMGRCFLIVVLAISAVTVIYTFFPRLYEHLTITGWPQQSATTIIGFLLLLLALIWILIAQAQMGVSWRIGIDHEVATPLVRQGLYRVSRNPIFLGMRLSLLGFVLALPNAITLAVLVLGDVLMQIQVRLEEEHLHRLHGEAYEQFLSETRRWL